MTERLPRDPPYSADPAVQEAYRCFLREDFDRAVRVLERLAGAHPRSAAFRNDLAVSLYLAGDRDRSIQALERASAIAGPRSASGINLSYLCDPDRFPEPSDRLDGRSYTLPPERADFTGALVSVILLEYNNPALTERCLRSILATQAGVPYEVILVDNSDQPASPAGGPADDVPNFRYHRSGANLGFAGGCNRGAALARGSLLYFANNDTLFREGCTAELARVLLADETVGIAGSKLLYEDGTVQHAGVVFDLYHNNPVHRGRGHPADDPFLNIPLKLRAVTGASLMIRRDLFHLLGGFCEAYRNGFEDVDLCFRAARAGRGVVYNPRSELIHLESRSRGRFRYERENLDLFRSRWPDRPDPDELALVSRKEHFLVGFTEDPAKTRRRAQLYRLAGFLEREHPLLLQRVPLFLLEKVKRLRIQKACRVLFLELLKQGHSEEARVLYRYARTRLLWHRSYVRQMRAELRRGRRDPAGPEERPGSREDVTARPRRP